MPANNLIDLGFHDVLEGTELFTTLGIDPLELVSPLQLTQIREIADFVNEFPEAMGLIRGAMFKKPHDVEATTHISRFANLHKNRFKVQQQLRSIEEELSLYE